MRIHGSPFRRAGLIAAAAMAAGAMLATPTAAAATPDPATLATTMANQLGSRSAGSYLDHATGRLAVTVTNSADARTVLAAGGVPRFVGRSGADLDKIMAALPRIAGTAWAVDPATNQVVVWADASVTGTRLAVMQTVVRRLGGAVRMERETGTFSANIQGGDAIYGGSSRCSLGFNVRSGSTYYFLTAGHCGNIASAWYSNSSHTTRIGTRRASSFPTNDYAIITYAAGISHIGRVNLYNGSFQDITAAGNAFVGQAVRRSGSTTRVRSGSVTGLNATVNYPQGTVYQMIRTNVCAQPGDSGGSLFAGTTALGLTSGGSGNCTTGGTTFFQPVTEALNVYGVNVY